MRAALPVRLLNWLSFNEAEACLPRMRLILGVRRSLGIRFNEAEACLPRMLDHFPDGKHLQPVASMRPRHVCLGCFNKELCHDSLE